MYKLHAFAQSGNAYKVAVLLQALRQPWTPVHMSIAFLIYWWFTTKLKAGRNWMRILITVLTILAFCMIPLLWNYLVKMAGQLYSQYPLDVALDCIQWILTLVVLWLLYTRRSRDWFTAVNS